MRDPALAVREMRRVAARRARTAFVAAMPIKGKSFGHPDFDPIWAEAEELDLAVGLHLVSHRHYTGSDFYHDPKPGLMYFSMNLIQDPRQALTTMVVDGVFERYPQAPRRDVEAMVGWVGEWLGAGRLSLSLHGAYVADEAASGGIFRSQHLDQRGS